MTDRTEIHRAIELLGRHGYQVWKDGGRIVTEADREQERQREHEREEMRRILDEQAKRPSAGGVWGKHGSIYGERHR